MKTHLHRILVVSVLGCPCVVLSGCGSDDGAHADADTGVVDSGTTNVCPAPVGPAIDHSGFVESDETWAAGLHRVTSTVTVRPGVTLTLEPCAIVQLAPDQSIVVDDEDAHLVAAGEADRPIRFERAVADQAWGSLSVFAPGTIDLAHATLDGGGTTASDPLLADLVGASLAGRNQLGVPTDTLRVDHVTIQRSAGLGVLLDSSGFMEGSQALTVTGSGLNPVYLGAGYATNLPALTLANNGDDRVLLQSAGPAVYDSSEPVLWDATLPDVGVAYLVGIEGTNPSIVVGDSRPESPGATLTIDPGVELHFQGGSTSSAGILVRGKPEGPGWVEQGQLVAVGTDEAPIVLRSAENPPGPGDWQGLYFQYVVGSETQLAHLDVSHAGGESASTGVCVSTVGAENYDADCSVVLFLEVAPSASFITDSRFADGAGCGIYRGWRGAAVDFASTNTFEALSGCEQSNVFNDDDRACVGGSCE